MKRRARFSTSAVVSGLLLVLVSVGLGYIIYDKIGFIQSDVTGGERGFSPLFIEAYVDGRVFVRNIGDKPVSVAGIAVFSADGKEFLWLNEYKRPVLIKPGEVRHFCLPFEHEQSVSIEGKKIIVRVTGTEGEMDGKAVVYEHPDTGWLIAFGGSSSGTTYHTDFYLNSIHLQNNIIYGAGRYYSSVINGVFRGMEIVRLNIGSFALDYSMIDHETTKTEEARLIVPNGTALYMGVDYYSSTYNCMVPGLFLVNQSNITQGLSTRIYKGASNPQEDARFSNYFVDDNSLFLVGSIDNNAPGFRDVLLMKLDLGKGSVSDYVSIGYVYNGRESDNEEGASVIVEGDIAYILASGPGPVTGDSSLVSDYSNIYLIKMNLTDHSILKAVILGDNARGRKEYAKDMYIEGDYIYITGYADYGNKDLLVAKLDKNLTLLWGYLIDSRKAADPQDAGESIVVVGDYVIVVGYYLKKPVIAAFYKDDGELAYIRTMNYTGAFYDALVAGDDAVYVAGFRRIQNLGISPAYSTNILGYIRVDCPCILVSEDGRESLVFTEESPFIFSFKMLGDYTGRFVVNTSWSSENVANPTIKDPYHRYVFYD